MKTLDFKKMDFFKKEVVVTAKEDNMRLDTFLSNHLSSRSQAEKIIKSALIKKQGSKTALKSSYKVKTGDCFELSVPVIAKTREIQSYNFPVPVVFEDEYLVIVNKPAGLVVHPSIGHEQDSLVNALTNKVNLSPGVHPLRPGVVHRLDQNVSGLMVLTKTKEAQDYMIQQFKLKKVRRFYRALCVGSLQRKEDQIISLIGRHPKDRKKFYSFREEPHLELKAGMKKAITNYKVLESFKEKIHHLECQLETGRTHQIRVHLSSIGLPILGDPLYSLGNKYRVLTDLGVKNLKKNILSLNRLALYSARIIFFHPITNQFLQFSLAWPEELHLLLKQCQFQIELK